MKSARVLGVVFLCFIILGVVASSGADETRMPKPNDVREMAKAVSFDTVAVIDRPIQTLKAELQTLKAEPDFEASISVYFATDEMIQIDPKFGAIVAKVETRGVPEIFQIPDGMYYLWIGIVDGIERAVLTKTDASMQTEVRITPVNDGTPSRTVESAVNLAQLPVPWQRPLPLPKPPPPPIRWKYITKKVCKNVNGKTVYVIERICVPAK